MKTLALASSARNPKYSAFATPLVLEPPRHFTMPGVFLVAGRHVVGTSPECSIRVVADDVGPQHAIIEVKGNRAVVQALDSRTWVNEGPVTEMTLRAGDRLSLGPLTFRVRAATHDELSAFEPEPTEALLANHEKPGPDRFNPQSFNQQLGGRTVYHDSQKLEPTLTPNKGENADEGLGENLGPREIHELVEKAFSGILSNVREDRVVETQSRIEEIGQPNGVQFETSTNSLVSATNVASPDVKERQSSLSAEGPDQLEQHSTVEGSFPNANPHTVPPLSSHSTVLDTPGGHAFIPSATTGHEIPLPSTADLLGERLDEIQQRLDELNLSSAGRAQMNRETGSSDESAAGERYRLDERQKELQLRADELARQTQQLHERVARLSERENEVERRQAQLASENERLVAAAESTRKALDEEYARHMTLWQEWDAAHQRTSNELNNQLAAMEQRRTALSAEAERMSIERSELQRLQAEHERDRRAIAAERVQLTRERAALQTQRVQFDSERQQLIVSIQEREAQVAAERRIIASAQEETLVAKKQLERDRTTFLAERSTDAVRREREVHEQVAMRERIERDRILMDEGLAELKQQRLQFEDEWKKLEAEREDAQKARQELANLWDRLRSSEDQLSELMIVRSEERQQLEETRLQLALMTKAQSVDAMTTAANNPNCESEFHDWVVAPYCQLPSVVLRESSPDSDAIALPVIPDVPTTSMNVELVREAESLSVDSESSVKGHVATEPLTSNVVEQEIAPADQLQSVHSLQCGSVGTAECLHSDTTIEGSSGVSSQVAVDLGANVADQHPTLLESPTLPDLPVLPFSPVLGGSENTTSPRTDFAANTSVSTGIVHAAAPIVATIVSHGIDREVDANPTNITIAGDCTPSGKTQNGNWYGVSASAESPVVSGTVFNSHEANHRIDSPTDSLASWSLNASSIVPDNDPTPSASTQVESAFDANSIWSTATALEEVPQSVETTLEEVRQEFGIPSTTESTQVAEGLADPGSTPWWPVATNSEAESESVSTDGLLENDEVASEAVTPDVEHHDVAHAESNESITDKPQLPAWWSNPVAPASDTKDGVADIRGVEDGPVDAKTEESTLSENEPAEMAHGKEEGVDGVSSLRAELAKMFDLQPTFVTEKETGKNTEVEEQPQSEEASASDAPADPNNEVSEAPQEEEESLEVYMAKLLARARGEEVSPKEVAALTSRELNKSGFLELGGSSGLKKSNPDFDPNDRSHLQAEPIHKQDVASVRDHIKSFREVAKISAQSALAKHTTKHLQSAIVAKGALCGVSAMATCAFLAGPLFGLRVQLLQGLSCALATLLAGFELFRSVAESKRFLAKGILTKPGNSSTEDSDTDATEGTKGGQDAELKLTEAATDEVVSENKASSNQ